MSVDKRRAKRRPISQRAWVDFGPGSRIHQCYVRDMSDTGARLTLPVVGAPPEFVLQFSPDGSVGRRCEVRWRAGREVGVRFTARIVKGRKLDFASLDC